MNLKSKLVEEIKEKGSNWSNLTKTLYVYTKLCEFFLFDPYYYPNPPGAISINRKIDSTKIENNLIICHGWTKVYEEIIKALEIVASAQIDDSALHSSISLKVDGFSINVDPISTINSEQFTVKERMPLKFFKLSDENKEKQEEFDEKLKDFYEIYGYNRFGKYDITHEEIMTMIKNELEYSSNYNKRKRQIDAIKLLVNRDSEFKRGFYDGREYINYLSMELIRVLPNCIEHHYINQDNETYSYLEVDIKTEDDTIFLIYHNLENDKYVLEDRSEERIVELINNYKKKNHINLKGLIVDEIKEKGSNSSEFTKLFYSYKRLCEILSYDPVFGYVIEMKEYLLKENFKLNSEDLSSKFVNCHGFARVFEEILKELEFEVENIFGWHSHLKVTLKNGMKVKIDPIALGISDTLRIKEGMIPENFTLFNTNEYLNEFDELLNSSLKEIGYNSFGRYNIAHQEIIEMIKEELSVLPDNKYGLEKRLEAIMILVNRDSKYKKCFSEGINYIDYLVGELTNISLAYSTYSKGVTFTSEVSRVYNITIDDEELFYLYHPKRNGVCVLEKITLEEKEKHCENHKKLEKGTKTKVQGGK